MSSFLSKKQIRALNTTNNTPPPLIPPHPHPNPPQQSPHPRPHHTSVTQPVVPISAIPPGPPRLFTAPPIISLAHTYNTHLLRCSTINGSCFIILQHLLSLYYQIDLSSSSLSSSSSRNNLVDKKLVLRITGLPKQDGMRNQSSDLSIELVSNISLNNTKNTANIEDRVNEFIINTVGVVGKITVNYNYKTSSKTITSTTSENSFPSYMKTTTTTSPSTTTTKTNEKHSTITILLQNIFNSYPLRQKRWSSPPSASHLHTILRRIVVDLALVLPDTRVVFDAGDFCGGVVCDVGFLSGGWNGRESADFEEGVMVGFVKRVGQVYGVSKSNSRGEVKDMSKPVFVNFENEKSGIRIVGYYTPPLIMTSTSTTQTMTPAVNVGKIYINGLPLDPEQLKMITMKPTRLSGDIRVFLTSSRSSGRSGMSTIRNNGASKAFNGINSVIDLLTLLVSELNRPKSNQSSSAPSSQLSYFLLIATTSPQDTSTVVNSERLFCRLNDNYDTVRIFKGFVAGVFRDLDCDSGDGKGDGKGGDGKGKRKARELELEARECESEMFLGERDYDGRRLKISSVSVSTNENENENESESDNPSPSSSSSDNYFKRGRLIVSEKVKPLTTVSASSSSSSSSAARAKDDAYNQLTNTTSWSKTRMRATTLSVSHTAASNPITNPTLQPRAPARFHNSRSTSTNTRMNTNNTVACTVMVPINVTKKMLQDSPVIIGQVQCKFVLIGCKVVSGDGKGKGGGTLVCCVDQHAADERVRVEMLDGIVLDDERRGFRFHYLSISDSGKNEKYSKKNKKQTYLETGVKLNPPITFSVTSTQKQTIITYDKLLKNNWAFKYDSIVSSKGEGDSVVKMHESSKVCGKLLGEDEFVEFVKMLSALEKKETSTPPTPPSIRRILNSHACRYAVMFGEVLNPQRMKDLIRELSVCEFPFCCAHGRPSIAPLGLIE